MAEQVSVQTGMQASMQADVQPRGKAGQQVGQIERLEAARSALRQAELRAGVRPLAQRHLLQRLPVPHGPASRGALALDSVALRETAAALSEVTALDSEPAPDGQVSRRVDSWEELVGTLHPGHGGVVSLRGSRALLLAAAGQRQGDGWCGVVAGEGIGWCAAQEMGVSLERTLVVTVGKGERARSRLPAVLASLLEAVEVVVLTGRVVAWISYALRRSLRARAQERGVTVLVDAAWEGARSWEVTSRETDCLGTDWLGTDWLGTDWQTGCQGMSCQAGCQSTSRQDAEILTWPLGRQGGGGPARQGVSRGQELVGDQAHGAQPAMLHGCSDTSPGTDVIRETQPAMLHGFSCSSCSSAGCSLSSSTSSSLGPWPCSQRAQDRASEMPAGYVQGVGWHLRGPHRSEGVVWHTADGLLCHRREPAPVRVTEGAHLRLLPGGAR